MAGTGGGKEAKWNNMDLLILDSLGKYNPSAEVWEVTTVLGWGKQLQISKRHNASVLPPDTPSPPCVRDKHINTYTVLRHTVRVTHCMVVLPYLANTVLFVATASHLQRDFGWFSGAKRAHPCWEVLTSSLKLDGNLSVYSSLPSITLQFTPFL